MTGPLLPTDEGTTDSFGRPRARRQISDLPTCFWLLRQSQLDFACRLRLNIAGLVENGLD